MSNPNGEQLNRVCITFTAVAGIFVALRLGVRIQRKVLGWDDAWILIAMIFSVVLTITVALSVGYGYGEHKADLSPHATTEALFWWYLAQVFYKCITWPTKISILFMYLRVFGTSETKAYGLRFRTLIRSVIAVVAACFIAFETAGIFACSPVSRSWDRTVPGHCLNASARYYAYVACNFFTDLVVLGMPIPLINGLNITKRQKLSLISVFLIGGFVCVATLVRVDKLNIGSNDITYSGTQSVLWSCIEANLGIICACLPLLRPLIGWLVPWFAQRSRSSRMTYDHGFHDYTQSHSNRKQQHSGHIDLRDKGRTVIMSNITARDPESESRASSQVAITQGIQRKVEVETFVELDTDRASDKGSEKGIERQPSDPVL